MRICLPLHHPNLLYTAPPHPTHLIVSTGYRRYLVNGYLEGQGFVVVVKTHPSCTKRQGTDYEDVDSTPRTYILFELSTREELDIEPAFHTHDLGSILLAVCPLHVHPVAWIDGGA